jgi:hypothetical protein
MDRAEMAARAADERERAADEREHEADERERAADGRDRVAQLRDRGVELRTRATGVRERAEQAIEEAKIVLEANRDGMRRAEAALNRAHANDAREQASAARAVTRGEQHPAPRPADHTSLCDRISELRKSTAAAAGRLARTEERVARIHDELAAREPENPQHKRLVGEAREAARQAREAEQKYS